MEDILIPLQVGYEKEVKASELVSRLEKLIAVYGDQKVALMYDKSYEVILTFGEEDEVTVLE